MKKIILITMMFIITTCSMVFAEASFDQIQQLIKNKEYSAAIKGLEIIIHNHPQSAKAYYAMAQAQTGVGNQVLAKKALDMAQGIDPTLKFASNGNVEKLKDAIQPQTKKIEAIESHGLRNTLLFLLFASGCGIVFYFWRKQEKQPSKEAVTESYNFSKSNENNTTYSAPKNFSKSPVNVSSSHERSSNITNSDIVPPVQSTTIINNSSSNNLASGMVGFAAGVAATELYESTKHKSHHDHSYVEDDRNYRSERSSSYVPKEEVIDRSWDEPKQSSTSSSWDDSSSKSSSWDDNSSSSSSSSWNSSSDSSSSSSWDSGSSSSDSGSSSSWD